MQQTNLTKRILLAKTLFVIFCTVARIGTAILIKEICQKWFKIISMEIPIFYKIS